MSDRPEYVPYSRFWKTRSVGCSWGEFFGGWFPESLLEPIKSPRLILLVAAGFFRDWNLPVLLSQLAFVSFEEDQVRALDEALDGRISPARLQDVLNLPSYVLPVGIWEKENTGNGRHLGRDVHEPPDGVLPDRVKLRFDIDAGPLPNRPANDLLAKTARYILRHHSETVLGHSLGDRADGNVEGRPTGYDPIAESPDVRPNRFGGLCHEE